MKFYLKRMLNMPFRLPVKVDWTACEGNIGVVSTDNAETIAALDGAIERRVGAIRKISEAEFNERKKNLAPSSRRVQSEVMAQPVRSLEPSARPSASSAAAAADKAPQIPQQKPRRGAAKMEPSEPTVKKGVLSLT